MAAPEKGATVTELRVTETGGFDGIGYIVAPDGRSVMAHGFDSGVDWVIDTSTGVATRAAFTSDEGVAFQRIAP